MTLEIDNFPLQIYALTLEIYIFLLELYDCLDKIYTFLLRIYTYLLPTYVNLKQMYVSLQQMYVSLQQIYISLAELVTCLDQKGVKFGEKGVKFDETGRLFPAIIILASLRFLRKKMKHQKLFKLSLIACLIFGFAVSTFAQTKLIKRTSYKSETLDFGAGGTVSVIGAPKGSIRIEGWNKNQVEISAEVEMQAETEADLAELSKINGFAIDDDFGHIRITSVGTHDKNYLKRVAKKFPKRLLNLPFKIDYTIKVPNFTDLAVDGGIGDFGLTNVEGLIRVNYLETNANLNLAGGMVVATIGKGDVTVVIPNRSWRGRSVDVQLVSGNLTAQLPINLNAHLDATVLRTGQIENLITTLKPRDRTKFSDRAINAKAGNGGAPMAFTVGEGTLKLMETEK